VVKHDEEAWTWVEAALYLHFEGFGSVEMGLGMEKMG